MDYSCLLQCGVNCNSVETTSTGPANIRLDEDVLIKTNMFASALGLQKTSSRRLGQDQYIRLGYTSSRRLQDVLQKRLQDIFKTS